MITGSKKESIGKRIAMGMLRSIRPDHGFILQSGRRAFQSADRNSLWRVFLPVVEPLPLILICTIIFSRIMRAGLPGVESCFGCGAGRCAASSDTPLENNDECRDLAPAFHTFNMSRTHVAATSRMESAMEVVIR